MHVFSKCGGLDIIRSDLSVCTALLDAAAAYDVPTTTLSPGDVLERFGLVVPSTHVGVFQADTGILHATTAVSMFQGLAAKHRAVLRDRTRIAGISRTEGGGVELRTDGGEVLRGKRVLLACGAWAGPMLASLFGLRVDLQVWQCTVMYWQAKAAGESAAAAAANAAQLAALPVVIDYGTSSVWTSTTAAPGAHTTRAATSATDGAETGQGASATPLPAPAEPLIYSCPSRELPGLIKFGVHQGVDVTADTR
jgi:glycine/D-amino acid oxidase-like deaminating enzyme